MVEEHSGTDHSVAHHCAVSPRSTYPLLCCVVRPSNQLITYCGNLIPQYPIDTPQVRPQPARRLFPKGPVRRGFVGQREIAKNLDLIENLWVSYSQQMVRMLGPSWDRVLITPF